MHWELIYLNAYNPYINVSLCLYVRKFIQSYAWSVRMKCKRTGWFVLNTSFWERVAYWEIIVFWQTVVFVKQYFVRNRNLCENVFFEKLKFVWSNSLLRSSCAGQLVPPKWYSKQETINIMCFRCTCNNYDKQLICQCRSTNIFSYMYVCLYFSTKSINTNVTENGRVKCKENYDKETRW